MAEKIPNPYKAAIKQHKESSVSPAQALAKSLDKIVTAMDAQAWVSPTADHYYTALNGNKRALGTTENTSLMTFQHAYDDEPDEVDVQDWRTHWAKIRQMMN